MKSRCIFTLPGSKGAESSRLLQRIFGVDTRPPNDTNTQLLKEYEQLVYADGWNTEKALALRSQLDDIFAGQEPKLTELDLYIENRQWELELEEDQGGLCAYCEQAIALRPESSQRVEHVHSKSDASQPGVNWALDWNNVVAVCLGGSSAIDDDHTRHPLPDNLSCDSHKAYLEQQGRIPKANEGYLLNPLDMPTFPNVFSFDEATGKLKANTTACASADFVGENTHASLADLVDKTIDALNLNCQRLCDERLEVLKHYNQQITKARKANNRDFRKQLASRWFYKRWPRFFTTRRALLGKPAEDYLVQVGFNG